MLAPFGQEEHTLERRSLGDAGLTYVHDRLAPGNTLSRLLLNQLDLTRGHAWDYLPRAVTDEQACHFERRGVPSLATGSLGESIEQPDGRWQSVYNLAYQIAVDHIQTFLAEQTQGVAIWEGPLSDAEHESARQQIQESLHFLGDEFY